QIAAGDRTQNRRRAGLLIQEWFGMETNAPASQATSAAADVSAPIVDGEPAPEDTAGGANPPLTFMFKHLDNRHPYLTQERGLAEATIDVFGLGYHVGKGIMHHRAVIPIHNDQGELVAYAGRWPGDDLPSGSGKYTSPPNFRKSLILFNLHRAREHAREGLIVVEGFFTVFEFWQRGRKNI